MPRQARDAAQYVGRGIIAGREVLLFDSEGQRWAEVLVGRSWAEGVGAPSNHDPEQIRKREG